MAKGRSVDKQILKEVVNDFNSNGSRQKKAKTYINKTDIDNSGITLSQKQQELYKIIRNNTIGVCILTD